MSRPTGLQVLGPLLSPCSSKIEGGTRTSRYRSPGVAICHGRHHRARSGCCCYGRFMDHGACSGDLLRCLIPQHEASSLPEKESSAAPCFMDFPPRIPQDMLNIKLIHSPKFFSTSLPYLCPSASAPPSTSPSVRSPTSRSPSPDLRPRYQEDQRERSLHDPAELSSVSR